MNIQATSNSQAQNKLQNQLVEMVKNAGEPLKQASIKNISDAVRENAELKNKDELKQKLVELSQDLNREMKRINTDINFSYNDDLHGLIVTVKDGGSGKVIREIPSEEAIELMKKMRDVIGNIFDKKA